MKRILIISTSVAEQELLQEVGTGENLSGLTIETTGSFGQDSNWWAQNAPDLLILSLPADEETQVYFLNKLKKDVPRTVPILFLCEKISAQMLQISRFFNRIRMVKTPIDGFHLHRAALDTITDFGPGKQQSQPRYLTNQAVLIFSDLKSGKLKGFMKNLSVSGAYVETHDKSLRLTGNDLVRLSIALSLDKEYVLDAKVIWHKKIVNASKPTEVDLFGIGLAFVNKNEVYETLLKNMG